MKDSEMNSNSTNICIKCQRPREEGGEDAIPSVMERTSYQSQKKIQNIQDVVGENWADDTYYL